MGPALRRGERGGEVQGRTRILNATGGCCALAASEVHPVSAALLYPSEPEPRVEAAAFVLALRGRGVSDLAVLRAMETVPRELFAPRRYGDLARQDVALPLACGETMTAPTVVALMLAALGVKPGHRVLEIGTGSGYVTALLARLGGAVLSAERRPTLAESAAHRLRAIGLAGACEIGCRDGLDSSGAAEARYDRILLNGTVPALPPGLTSRLAAGGRLVCGREEGGSTRVVTVARDEAGQLCVRSGTPVRLSRLFVQPGVPEATES